MVEALVCGRDWLRTPTTLKNYEENFQELEKIEKSFHFSFNFTICFCFISMFLYLFVNTFILSFFYFSEKCFANTTIVASVDPSLAALNIYD